MRTETSEALARLVGCFVAAIEDTGTQIPSDVVEHLTENPLKSCEALNDLALSCGAIDDALDAALAAIYESMDAADARGEVDEFTAERIARTWVRTHREPEPEPEPDPEPEPEPEVYEGHGDATDEREEPAEEAPQPKKKRRNRKQKADEVAESNVAETGDQEATLGHEPTPEPVPADDAAENSVPEKPKKRRTRKAEKPAAEAAEPVAPVEDAAPAAAGEDAQPEEAAPATETTPAAGDEPAAAADAQPEPAAAADAQPESATVPAPSDETLSVDQVVAILGVSRPTIYKLIESGELPASKKGRSWRISAAAVSERANQ